MEVYDEYLLKRWDDIPKLDGNPCLAVTHDVKFVEYNSWYEMNQNDVKTQLFLQYLDKKQINLIKHACIPKGQTYSTILI
jgi:hypothetical protein